jgi:hypothetical protein
VNGRNTEAFTVSQMGALGGVGRFGLTGRPRFCAAIEACGKFLAEHFSPGRRDANELPNHLIVRGARAEQSGELRNCITE